MKQDYVAQHYSQATYVINLANMKSHMGAGITVAQRTITGRSSACRPTADITILHQSLAFMSPQMGSYRALVDLMGHAHLGGKTFCISSTDFMREIITMIPCLINGR